MLNVGSAPLFIIMLPSALVTSFHSRRLPGWNDGARALKSKANFWHRAWLEAGSPSAGVLTELRKKAKSRSKYEVRRLKRREQFIRCDKLAGAFTPRNRKSFWREVKKLRGKSHSASHSVIDGVSDPCEVSDVFRDKLADTLNKYAKHPFDPSSLVMVEDDLHFCSVSSEVVFEAFKHLKRGKRDDSSPMWSFPDLKPFSEMPSPLLIELCVLFSGVFFPCFLSCEVWFAVSKSILCVLQALCCCAACFSICGWL